MQSCWVGGMFGVFFVPDKVSWRYFLTAQVNVLNLFFPFWGLCRQIPQQHLMIRSDSSSRDIFKSYLQCVPSGPTKEQSFSEQYILVILFFFFLVHLEINLALQCHANTQGFTQIKLLSRHWELCQEKSKQGS